jgi:hypothetical protein
MFYRTILCNSKDLSIIGELRQARQKQLQLVLNKGGQFSYRFPMTDDLAASIVDYSTGVRLFRYNWRASSVEVVESAIYPEDSLYPSDTLYPSADYQRKINVWDEVWSGYTMPIQEDLATGWMNVTCVGWQQRPEKRILRRDKTYPYKNGISTDDGDIMLDLVNEMNLTTAPDGSGYAIPVVAGSSPATPTWIQAGSKLPNEGVGGATAYTPAYRGMTFSKFQSVLPMMEQLTNIENGCDIYLDPTTRTLDVFRRRERVLNDVHFGLNWGPFNIAQLGRNIDPSSRVNYLAVSGAVGSKPMFQDNLPTQAEVGIIEEYVSLPGVVDPPPPAQSIIWSYAAAEVAIRSGARQTFEITPFMYSPGGSVPEPFVDYRLGDTTRFSAVLKPRVSIKGQQARIFGMSVSIEDSGVERLNALTIAPS